MKTDLTTGSITKLLIKLGIPAFGSMFSDILFHLINMFWIGKLGYQALAAQTSSAFVLWMLFTFTNLVTIGTTSIIARKIGEKELDKAQIVATRSIVLSLYLSIFISLVFLLSIEYIMNFIQAEENITHLAIEFLTIFILGTPSLFLFSVIDAIFRGYGNTKIPMFILLLSLAFNMILDPIFIFGLDYGFKGAAYATIISRLIGTILGAILLKKHILKDKKCLTLDNLYQLDINLSLQLIKIGAPPMFSGILFSIVYVIIAKIINLFGPEALAAIGIGHRIESISFCTFMALGIATTSIVGQNIGARKIERVIQTVHKAYFISFIIAFFIGILFLFFSEHIIKLMTNEAKVIEIGSWYLKITTSSLLFMALEIITQGAFNGVGNTLPPMILNIVFTLLRIPLVYLLAIQLNWGINGVWWAINISSILKGASLAYWFSLGRWRKYSVLHN